MSDNAEAGKLAEELEALAGDAEALLAASASANGTDGQGERIAATLSNLKARLGALEDLAGERARALDEFVHENPWRSIAIAGCAGLIVGLLLARR
jgi:ElaB/YqjD/DUF883 family membrane-anchored ribosome-binding protein